MRLTGTILILGLLASQSVAMAGQVDGTVGMKGHVTNQVCTLGTVGANDSIFNVGVLVDTSTGYLSSNLAVPPKILTGSFCNTKSVISIAATPMKAQDVGASSPTGFSQAVDYTATASGWTTAPAAYTTSAAANPGASQIQPTPFSGNITVSLSNFATTGGNTLRLVADPLYQGIVTITLAASS